MNHLLWKNLQNKFASRDRVENRKKLRNLLKNPRGNPAQKNQIKNVKNLSESPIRSRLKRRKHNRRKN